MAAYSGSQARVQDWAYFVPDCIGICFRGVSPCDASWKWGPVPLNRSRPTLGEEIYGPTTNTDHHIHFVTFADDIFVLECHWTKMMNKLALLKRRLLDAEFNIADDKT
eukprot:530227-Amphidinium_carterae.1